MSNTIENKVLKQAFDALKLIASQDQGCGGTYTEADAWRSAKYIALTNIASIKEGLSKVSTFSKPVAWMDANQPWDLYKNKPNIEAHPLYTEPPQHALMAKHWKDKHDELQNRMETLFRCPRCWYSEIVPNRSWTGLTVEDKKEYVAQDFGGNRLDAMDWAEKRLKEKNT